MANVNNGHRQRVRERMLKEGLDGFQDHEILELLLYQSIPRKDTNKIAHKLLLAFGNLSNVINASPNRRRLNWVRNRYRYGNGTIIFRLRLNVLQ